MAYMTSLMHNSTKYGGRLRISRCGYTGEDGFELSMNLSVAENVIHDIMKVSNGKAEIVKWSGYQARNSLRLESGFCAYGYEFGEGVRLAEANLL